VKFALGRMTWQIARERPVGQHPRTPMFSVVRIAVRALHKTAQRADLWLGNPQVDTEAILRFAFAV
jgi:hypothetical protein